MALTKQQVDFVEDWLAAKDELDRAKRIELELRKKVAGFLLSKNWENSEEQTVKDVFALGETKYDIKASTSTNTKLPTDKDELAELFDLIVYDEAEGKELFEVKPTITTAKAKSLQEDYPDSPLLSFITFSPSPTPTVSVKEQK